MRLHGHQEGHSEVPGSSGFFSGPKLRADFPQRTPSGDWQVATASSAPLTEQLTEEQGYTCSHAQWVPDSAEEAGSGLLGVLCAKAHK